MGPSLFSLFGIKDLVDILLVATLLFYLYRTMKDSGTLNIFVGVFAFIVAWVIVDKLLDMKLLGTIMDRIIDSGIFILIIIFQDQIKRFLTGLGSKRGWKSIAKLWHSGQPKSSRKKSSLTWTGSTKLFNSLFLWISARNDEITTRKP